MEGWREEGSEREREGGMEGGREGTREGEEGGREGGRDGGREGGNEGGRGGREGREREREREGGREGGRGGGHLLMVGLLAALYEGRYQLARGQKAAHAYPRLHGRARAVLEEGWGELVEQDSEPLEATSPLLGGVTGMWLMKIQFGNGTQEQHMEKWKQLGCDTGMGRTFSGACSTSAALSVSTFKASS